MEAITIDASNADQRFDRFLRKYFKPYPDITLGDIFRWIRKRNILVNNRKTKENTRLQIGDVITFHIQSLDDRFKTAPTKTAKTNLIHTQEIAEHIIYQDTNRIVRNKPPHMVVHGGNHHENDLSLQDLLRIYCERMTITDPEIIGTFQPSLCYRLDRDTSGVLVSAITYPALQHLNQQIRDRLVTKTYRAILVGHAPDHRIADEPLFKGYNRKFGRAQSFVNYDQGKPALSHFTTLETRTDTNIGPLSLVDIDIHTGRMHQIRVHAAHRGHPVLGDQMYGNELANIHAYKHQRTNRQLLHAYEYLFTDIDGSTITIQAPLTRDFFGPQTTDDHTL